MVLMVVALTTTTATAAEQQKLRGYRSGLGGGMNMSNPKPDCTDAKVAKAQSAWCKRYWQMHRDMRR